MVKVLIIDDDPDFVQLIKITLPKEEFEIFFANKGKEGFDKSQSEKPDFIILDQILPDLSGVDVLKLIKESPITHLTPVLMISAYGFPKIEEEARKYGAVAYLYKFDNSLKELAQKIKSNIKPT